MKLPNLAWVGLSAALAVAACSSDQLFSSGGTTTPTGTGGSTTSTSSGGGGASTTTSTSSSSGAFGGGGATTTTTTTTSMGGAGGFGGAPAEIPCGNQTCLAPEICCVSYYGPDYDQCGPSGSCDGNSLEAACNGPSDCPEGWLCCGRWVVNGQYGYYTDVACSPTCVPDGGSDGVVLCDTQEDCPLGTCQQSGSLPLGYSVCII